MIFGILGLFQLSKLFNFSRWYPNLSVGFQEINYIWNNENNQCEKQFAKLSLTGINVDQVPREREFFESGHSDDEVILQLPVASIAKFGNFAGSRVFRLDWCLRGSGKNDGKGTVPRLLTLPPMKRPSSISLAERQRRSFARAIFFFFFFFSFRGSSWRLNETR